MLCPIDGVIVGVFMMGHMVPNVAATGEFFAPAWLQLGGEAPSTGSNINNPASSVIAAVSVSIDQNVVNGNYRNDFNQYFGPLAFPVASQQVITLRNNGGGVVLFVVEAYITLSEYAPRR
jgi:hypothetical protein